jgi:hypothetical protein
MATHPTAIPAEFLVGARARYSGFGTPEDTRDHFKFLVSRDSPAPASPSIFPPRSASTRITLLRRERWARSEWPAAP